MTEQNPKAFATHKAPEPVSLTWIESAALARLIEEVRNTGGPPVDATAYNRTYHRHNR